MKRNSKKGTVKTQRDATQHYFARDTDVGVKYNGKGNTSREGDESDKKITNDVVKSPVRLDPESYRAYVQLQGLTDRQKDDMIRVVMSIVESFVDRAFGDDPTQLAVEAAHRDDDAIDDDAEVAAGSFNPPMLPQPEPW